MRSGPGVSRNGVTQLSDPGGISQKASVFLGLGVAAAAFLLMTFRHTGLFPVVFADEYFYSLFSRLAPLEASPRPFYLYFIFYGLTNACGEGFLECARIMNSLFIVSALPFIYLVGRRVTTRGVAILVAGISVAGPISTFAAYFMPEGMYFFGFWAFLWAVLKVRDLSWPIYAAAVGISLGLLALVKAHAVFLLGGIWLFEILRRREESLKEPARDFLRVLLLSAAAFLAVRLGLGYLFAGMRGLSILGQDYTSIGIATNDETANFLLSLVRDSLASLGGHALGLSMLFPVPIAIAVRYLRTGRATGAVGGRGGEIVSLTIALSVVLLAVTAVFTARVADLGPGQSVWRLHARYYEFVFPLFLLAAASQIDTSTLRVLSVRGWIGTAAGAVLVVAAYPALTKYYSPSFIDSPAFRGVTMMQESGWAVVVLGALCLVVWAWSSKWGAKLYLLLFVPVTFGVATLLASSELRTRMMPDTVDHAGKFARLVLGDDVGKLVVAGADPASVYKACFHVDHQGTTRLFLKPGERLSTCRIATDRDWVLLLGSQETDLPRRRQIAVQDYALINLKSTMEVAFSEPAWPLRFRASGLSGPEPWGRWSDGERVILQFDFPLPSKARVTLVAQAFGPNVGRPFVVRFGQEEKELRLDASPRAVALEFETADTAQVIQIVVPEPVSPRELGIGSDIRRLGIGLASILIEDLAVDTTRDCE